LAPWLSAPAPQHRLKLNTKKIFRCHHSYNCTLFFRREHVGRRYGRAGHSWPGRERWPVPPGRGPCRPPAVPGGEGQCAGARQESRQAAIFFSQNPLCHFGVTSVFESDFGEMRMIKIEECCSDNYKGKKLYK
jgi:hypothetical protein